MFNKAAELLRDHGNVYFIQSSLKWDLFIKELQQINDNKLSYFFNRRIISIFITLS